jgi:hypothetical protein
LIKEINKHLIKELLTIDDLTLENIDNLQLLNDFIADDFLDTIISDINTISLLENAESDFMYEELMEKTIICHENAKKNVYKYIKNNIPDINSFYNEIQKK